MQVEVLLFNIAVCLERYFTGRIDDRTDTWSRWWLPHAGQWCLLPRRLDLLNNNSIWYFSALFYCNQSASCRRMILLFLSAKHDLRLYLQAVPLPYTWCMVPMLLLFQCTSVHILFLNVILFSVISYSKG